MNRSFLKLNTRLCQLASCGLGLLIGYLDFHAEEVQGTALLLLLTTGLLSLLHPRGAWRWAVLTGLGIPLVHYAAHVLNIRLIHPLENRIAVVVLPQIPALVGAYAGVLAHKLARDF